MVEEWTNISKFQAKIITKYLFSFSCISVFSTAYTVGALSQVDELLLPHS